MFFLIGGIFIVFVKSPSWVVVLAPFTMGMLYSIVNFIPLPFDDVLVAVAGAMISFIIAITKYSDVSKTIIFPMGAAALYTVIGDFIPTPVDDLLVTIIGTGTTAYIGKSSMKALDDPIPQPSSFTVEGSTVDSELS